MARHAWHTSNLCKKAPGTYWQFVTNFDHFDYFCMLRLYIFVHAQTGIAPAFLAFRAKKAGMRNE
jgi:hypothetical protein